MKEHQTVAASGTIDMALRIAFVGGLIYASVQILQPFGPILVGGVLLSVLIQPLHAVLARRMPSAWAATTIALGGILIITVPMFVAGNAIAGSLQELVVGIRTQTLDIGPPPPWLATLPGVGADLDKAWVAADANLPAAMKQYAAELKGFATALAELAGRVARSALLFLAAFIVGVLLVAYRSGLLRLTKAVAIRLAGDADRGEHQLRLAGSTIVGVATGILGVAVIQTVLVGGGFFVAGVPLAGLLTLIVLFVAIIQMPVVLATIPAILWAFAKLETGPAILFTVWCIVAGASDAVLKPLLVGRGSEIPMPVILLGVLGGMILNGFVGMFLGPVILGILWVAMSEWAGPEAGATNPEGDPGQAAQVGEEAFAPDASQKRRLP